MVIINKAFIVAFLGIILLALLVSIPLIVAHNSEEKIINRDMGLTIKYRALIIILIASSISIVLVMISILIHKKSEKLKWALFLGICIPLIAATAYSAASTIYLNLSSVSQGPVHWHADFDVYDCGKKADLIDPEGISNRVGSPVFHEHGDNRIHLEGVVMGVDDVELNHFFEIIGGELSEDRITFPQDGGVLQRQNGEICNGKVGKLQVFVYSTVNPSDTKNWIYEQRKVTDFTHYKLAPFTHVPPGDCIIIEFDEEKEKTDKLCVSYEFAQLRGELRGN